MKIAFFTNTYLPNSYGSSVSIEYFRKGLEALGHEVTVFAPKWKGYQDVSDRVVRYPAIQWNYKLKYPIAIAWWPPMRSFIRKQGFDIIHSHQPFSLGREGLRMARQLDLPMIFTHHCRYEEYLHYVPALPDSFLRWYVSRAATDFANHCDRVIAPSREIRELIIERGVKQPVEVLPTGIDWDRYQMGKREEIRKKYEIERKDFCLLWVGRLAREKNIEFLLKVINVLKQKNLPVKLLLAGEGAEKESLSVLAQKTGIEKLVIFAGFVPQEKLSDYYAAADLFVQPSLSETQGMSVTESLAAGLPVVAVRASGSLTLVQDGGNGFLADLDAAQFAEAAERILTNEKLRKKMVDFARNSAKKYDYKEKAKELEEIYRVVLKK
jgi:glycosyltransferase involved in cell wall biosynthesis